MTLIKQFLQLALIVMGSSLAMTTLAQTKSVGSFVRVSGDANIQRGDEGILKARNGQEVFAGDVVRTSDDSWVTINFFDLTRIVLRPNSEFWLHRFPQTMDSGEIEFELKSGAARVTTGTISNGAPHRFNFFTPHGVVRGSRSEWVVNLCLEDDCKLRQESFKRCDHYVNPGQTPRQFLAVYSGVAEIDYCAANEGTPGNALQRITSGQTMMIGNSPPNCKLLENIPCFILSDGKLGRDKLKEFLPKLTPTEESEEGQRPDARHKRPDSRPPMPRPRVNRPPPRRRGG